MEIVVTSNSNARKEVIMLPGLILVSTIVLTTSFKLPTDTFSCMDGPLDGFYCSNDLSGYHNCNEKALTFGKVNCSVGTRCTCGINLRCHVYEKKICQTIPPVMTPPESFEYSYVEQHFEQPARAKKADYVIHVTRDSESEMFAIKVMDKLTNVNHFEIIKPQGGKYAMYKGYTGTCNKTTIDCFPSYWEDYSMYSLFLSHRAERHYTFSMGPRIRDGTGISKYITFFKLKDKAPYPIKMLGGVRTAIDTLMKFTATTSFKERTPPSSSFDLPPSCLTASSLFDELL